MKILLTGGAGFIGSHVADRYLSDGHEVIILDDLSTGFEKNVNPGAEFHKLDIRAKETANLIGQVHPEVINHHAAQIDLRRSVADPMLDAQINILGLLNIMEAAVKTGSLKQIIFASTGGALYGDADLIPTPEDYPARPVSPYGVAKLTGEHYLHYYHTAFGIPYTVLRYGNVYGPRQNPEGEAGVVAIFSSRMMKGQRVVINGDGKQTRDYVSVRDVVEANARALGGKKEGIYNIGTGKETDVNTIFRILADLLAPEMGEEHGPQKQGEQRRSALDCVKAKQELGWEPAVPIEDGLSETANYFKAS